MSRTAFHTSSRTRRRVRRRTTARAAAYGATAAAFAGVLALTGVAPAAAAPRQAAPSFLAADELPPHPSSAWYAGDVTQGRPEHPVFCLDEVLTAGGTSYRDFWTEYDTNAGQFVVRAKDARAARTFAARAERAVRGCAGAYEAEFPDGSASWRDYGRLGVEDGAHVYGIATRTDFGANDINLFAVGRDGRTVTVVRWGQMGTFQHAEVEPFKATTRTAVAKLAP